MATQTLPGMPADPPSGDDQDRKGIRWYQQEFDKGTTLLDVLQEVRLSIRSGDFNLRDWDHNSPNRKLGQSNKQITIAGAMLLATGGIRPDLPYPRYRDAVIEAVIGR